MIGRYANRLGHEPLLSDSGPQPRSHYGAALGPQLASQLDGRPADSFRSARPSLAAGNERKNNNPASMGDKTHQRALRFGRPSECCDSSGRLGAMRAPSREWAFPSSL